ncbi:MAG: amylovoran biosynthesis AmsK, partial [Bacteroidetes bacterium]|nr:amylovoran biosynthesis AmsK [Bacteroidota bacterium]
TIELLSHIKSPFTWHYYGEGHLIEELKALAKTKLPEGSYIFHGQCKREEIFALYKSAGISAMIHTSELEGIPVSLMEAASFGIPIIACDTCGVGEITNSHTGILLPLDFNIAQTAAHIETFCREKGNTIEFRNSVKKYCSEFFNIKLNATRTAKRLKELSQT